MIVVVAHAGGFASWRAWAQGIGVNFVGAAGETGTLQPADVAGVPGAAQAWWNNVPDTVTSLLDSSGRATTLEVAWGACGGLGTNGTLETGPDFALMRGSLNQCFAGNAVHLMRIPYRVYDVIVYMSGPGSSSGLFGYFSPANFQSWPPDAEGYSPRVLYSGTFAGQYSQATTNSPGNYYKFTGLNFGSITFTSINFPIAAVQVIRSSGTPTVPTLLSATVPGDRGSAKFWLTNTSLHFEIQLYYGYGNDPALDLHGPAPPGGIGPLITNLPSAICREIEAPRCRPLTGTVEVTAEHAANLRAERCYLVVTPRTGPYPQTRAAIVNNSNPTPTLRMYQAGEGLTLQWPTASRDFGVESTSALSQSWETVTNAVEISGNVYSVAVGWPVESRFFRLRSTP